MNRSFGKLIKQFALSVDIISKDQMQDIQNLLESFFKDKLGIVFFELLIVNPNDEDEGLLMIWSNTRKKWISNSVKNVDGSYKGQTSFAFKMKKPLWIVTSDKKELSGSTNYIDLWSNLTDIPQYWKYNKYKIHTSIILPLVDESDNVLYLLNLESEDYLEISPQAKEELALISDALLILLRIEDYSTERDINTSHAITYLTKIKENTPLIRKPRVFIASSLNADTEVTAAIITTIKKYKDYFDIRYWKDIADSGNINSQILKEISQASFGICYLSEKNENGEFVDNPNVLFEAGMLHSLVNKPELEPEAWIPIRENSNNIPFDFQSERILFVDRNDNDLSKDEFMSKLEKRIKKIVEYLQ